MDYTHAMVCSLLGAGPALAIFFLLAQNAEHGFRLLPGGSFWPWEPLFGSMEVSHSTVPSFSRRIRRWARLMTTWTGKFIPATITTRYTAFVSCLTEETHQHRNSNHPSILEHSRNFRRTIFRVVYLKDDQRVFKNEAIEIEILSGRNAGFHDSYDARPFGKWLEISIGATLGAFGFAGLKYMKDDAKSAASSDNDDAS